MFLEVPSALEILFQLENFPAIFITLGRRISYNQMKRESCCVKFS